MEALSHQASMGSPGHTTLSICRSHCPGPACQQMWGEPANGPASRSTTPLSSLLSGAPCPHSQVAHQNQQPDLPLTHGGGCTSQA